MDISVDTIKRYQRYFKKLIELERQEEINFHLSEIISLSGHQREKKGRAILNLSGRDHGRGLGGIYLVRMSKNGPLPDTEISVGDLVILSAGHPSGEEPQAVVTEKGSFFITLAYHHTPPPYAFKQRLRLDLFANDVTFQRMLDALFNLKEHQIISDLLLNLRTPRKSEKIRKTEFIQTGLNKSQKDAITESLRAIDCFLIHGPPGTGKTTTLIESIFQHVKLKKKVLATADSNTAVDNLVEKLSGTQYSVVRVGNPARMNEAIANVSIDQLVQDNPDYQQAESIREFIPELREEQRKHIQPTGPSRRGLTDDQILKLSRRGATNRGINQHKIHKMAEWIKIQQQINAMQDEAWKLEKKAVKEILSTAEVVCATNSAAGSELLVNQKFDVCFIDEATQSMEPSCLISMTKAQKWILAGDHRQLPPTVLSKDAENLHHTLFERWIESQGKKHSFLLKIQYRMHENIMEFPNNEFYQGKLTAAPSVRHHHIGQLSGFQIPPDLSTESTRTMDPENPIVFINVINGEEKQIKGSFSYYNKEEVNCIRTLTDNLMACRLFPEDLGIISPYDQQVSNLKSVLAGSGIEIKTVDGFQGREKEIILISLVRANDQGNLGFLTDYRRLNVALTRARRKLIIVGHLTTLQKNPVYSRLIEFIRDKMEWRG